MSERTVLVTGGAGFIGSAIVRKLVEAGTRVRVFDDQSRGTIRRLRGLEQEIDFVDGDIRNSLQVSRAAQEVDCVIHLAYVNGTRYFYEDPELVLDVAIRGMLNVLEACRSNRVRDLVLASSSEVYQTPPKIPTDESAPLIVPDVLNPRYSYGAGKIISEVLAINFGRRDFDRVAIFRPHNVYGPDMGSEHVVPQLISRSLRAISETPEGPVRLELQGDGTQTRAFIFIEDCADAIVQIVDRGKHNGIYHVGNPEEVSIAGLAGQIMSILGRELELVPGPAPEGEAKRRCPDITRLKELGFTPRVGLGEGLARTIEWYSNDRYLAGESR